MDLSLQEEIADILSLFTKKITLNEFLAEMEFFSGDQVPCKPKEVFAIMQQVTNKLCFMEKIDKIKQLNLPVYHSFLKTCVRLFLASENPSFEIDINYVPRVIYQEFSSDDLRKLVDNKLEKTNVLIKNIGDSNDDSISNHLDKSFELDKFANLEVSEDLEFKSAFVNHSSFKQQEQKLILDLLNLLSGLDGDFIWRDKTTNGTFKFFDGIKGHFLTMINSILPLVRNYDKIDSFAKKELLFKGGCVNNALAGVLLEILIIERFLINDIRDEQTSLCEMNLHSFWTKLVHHLESSAFIVRVIDELIKEDAFGGKTLSVLYSFVKCTNRNEPHFETAYHLLTKSSKPYFEMLNDWLKTGAFFDVNLEFLVIDEMVKNQPMSNTFITNDYDNRRYLLRPKEQIPIFLQNSSELILSAGKTRAILRKLHILQKDDTWTWIEMNLNHNYFDNIICQIYKSCNEELKRYIDNESNFRQRLNIMRQFMLLERGDFIYQLMVACEPLLSKKFSESVAVKVQHVFESVKKSFQQYSPAGFNVDDIELQFLSYDLNYQSKSNDMECHVTMTGFDYICLNIKVQWPFTIIFSPSIIENYKLLFRHLFYYKWAEYSLCSTWWLINNLHKKSAKIPSFCLKAISALRGHMLCTIQVIEYYISNEVIEKHFKDFMKKLDNSQISLDYIKENHEKFVNNCLLESMLIDKHIYGTICKLLKVSQAFCQFVKELDNAKIEHLTNITFNFYTNSQLNEDGVSETVGYGVGDTIQYFQMEYSRIIGTFFNLLQKTQNDKMISLITRIDLNSFYVQEDESLSE